MTQYAKLLTRSEEELMELFWNRSEPLTSVEILNIDVNRSWNDSYIHIMLRSLLKKGTIKVCGTVQYGTQYARQFIPIMTKEEYTAKIIISKGLEKKSIAKVTLAMVKETSGKGEIDVIKQLEEIIDELKENKTKEK